ncbi:MAG: hypothetical protein CK425_01470 [Parachlamydia sp.]|nr:MAG: hypothetical protein CK425_01470 [Parachlamydia sp.]
MTTTIKFNNSDDFHNKISDIQEVIKGDKFLRTDLSIKAKDGRFYKLIKILLSILPGDRFEKTRIYNVAASIEKLCNDHKTWVSQQDKDNLTSVFDFLQTLSSKSKSQKRRDLNEKAIKSAREFIAKLGLSTPSTSTSKKKTPAAPSPILEFGELEKMLKEMPSFYEDGGTSKEEAKQNREKDKNILGSYLLNLKQEEALETHQKYKISNLLDGDNGQWLTDNFSKLSPAAIAQITNACRGQKVWSAYLLPLLAKTGNASQLKAFAQTHSLYQGENNLAWNDPKNNEGLNLALYSAWVIKNWKTSSIQEILDKLSLEDRKGWIKSLVGYAAGYEKSIDSLFSFVEALPLDIRAAAIEELNQTTSPNVLRELLTRGWGNDLTLDSLWPSDSNADFGWYHVMPNAEGPDLTPPFYQRVYNLLMESPGNRSQEIKSFFDTILKNKEALEAIGLQIRPEHFAKLNAASLILESILDMSIQIIASGPSERRDELLKGMAKLAVPVLNEYTIKSDFQRWEQPFIKLFEAGVSDFQVGLAQKLPYDLALPFLKTLSPEQFVLICQSKDKYKLKNNGFPPSIVGELKPAQIAGLINGICEAASSKPETDKQGYEQVKKEIVTSYLKEFLKSSPKEQFPILINQINYNNLKFIDLLAENNPQSDSIIFLDLIPLLRDMTQPNQRFLIGNGIANLSKYTLDKDLHAALELLNDEQMLNLPFEKLPTVLNILLFSKANGPQKMRKQLLSQIDQMSEKDIAGFGSLLRSFPFDTTSLIKVLAQPAADQKTTSLRKNVMQEIVNSWNYVHGFTDPLPEEVISQIKTMSPEQFSNSMTKFGSEKNRWKLLENHSLETLHDSACKLWVNQLELNFYSSPQFTQFLNYLEEKKVTEVLKIVLGKTYQPQVATGGEAYLGLRRTLRFLENSPGLLQNFNKDEIDWKGLMQYSFNLYPELKTTYPKCYAIIQKNAQ